MTNKNQQPTLLEIYPTVFPDFNLKNGYAPDQQTSQIAVQRMKHKHIRLMQTMNETQQVEYVMTELTGLSVKDLDELDAEDSAALSEIIFNYMRKYAEIAKEFMQ